LTKYLRKKIKRGKIYFCLTVSEILSMLGSIVSEPVVRQSIMAEKCGGAEILTLWWPGSRNSD
jgi:hypothetical protein